MKLLGNRRIIIIILVMTSHLILHIIDSAPTRRAQMGRLSCEAGIHAEIYHDVDEWIAAVPKFGILLVHDDGDRSLIPGLISQVARAGRWSPVIGYSRLPTISIVIDAIKGGALNFIPIPEEGAALVRAVLAIENEIGRSREIWERAVKARNDIARLSIRERQVLEGIVSGLNNKTIARDLDISPRTVEIHRMKMLGKLGARNAADAVRVCAEASICRPLAA